MTKMRVHELAKELGMENKELIELLGKNKVDVKSHMSSVTADTAEHIRKAKPAPKDNPIE